LFEWHVPQVVAVQERHVEQIDDDVLRAVRIERVLQRLKTRYAIAIEHHRFAVEPGAFDVELFECLHLLVELCGPIVACAREHLERTGLCVSVDASQYTIAVELDFVCPFIAGWRGVDERRQLRLEGGGQRGLDRAFNRGRCGKLAQ